MYLALTVFNFSSSKSFEKLNKPCWIWHNSMWPFVTKQDFPLKGFPNVMSFIRSKVIGLWPVERFRCSMTDRCQLFYYLIHKSFSSEVIGLLADKRSGSSMMTDRCNLYSLHNKDMRKIKGKRSVSVVYISTSWRDSN